MSTVDFKAACAAHRKCCPYKATPSTKCKVETRIKRIYMRGIKVGKCGANVETPDGKCPIKDCYYMAKFKRTLKKLSEK